MRTVLWRIVRALAAIGVMWGTCAGCRALGANRSTASMTLLLEIVLIATLGDWYLSIIASAAGSLAFSWFFVEGIGSFHISTIEGGVTFSAMVITAMTVSHIAVRSGERALEAERRREEMERLQNFGSALLTAPTVREAAEQAVRNAVCIFGLNGASIHLADSERKVSSGSTDGGESVVLIGDGSELRLYGDPPSHEVSRALGHLLKLALDKTREAEERSRAETTRRGEELQSAVLNALAHNFKTPLTSIKAASSALRHSEFSRATEGRELVEIIDEEADHLEKLIGESLNLARIESHQANPRRESCSLATIVNNVTDQAGRYLQGRELRVDVPSDLPRIEGDRFLFEQMLMQVVDNAWKYSTPGAKIEITGSASQDRVILTVRNEGNAIPADEKDKIFGKFYRRAVTSQVEGSGLGLAIAKAIAEAHRGAIWLDSEPQGPAFRLSLPVEANGDEE